MTARIPTRTNRDDRYFTDSFQVMPKHGYTRMFERMLDHPNIKIMLNTDYREIESFVPYRELIWTGPVDEFFDYQFGPLPYRSLEFRFETHPTEVFQPVGTVNYPNDYDYTRVTEFKHLTGQRHPMTTIVYEYPRARETRTIRFRGPTTPSATRPTKHSRNRRPTSISLAASPRTATTIWTR